VGNTHFSYFPFKAESQNLVEGRAFVIEPAGNILVDLMVWILALEECNLSIQVLGLLVCRNSGVDDVKSHIIISRAFSDPQESYPPYLKIKK
jgi:hypothetical protein